MAALGVNTLQTRCSGECLITLQDTSKAGDKAIRMTDGRCYYIYAISGYIKSLIHRGMNVGHPNFLLPTRSPITAMDLQMLGINPAEVLLNRPAPVSVFVPLQGNLDDPTMYTINNIRERWGTMYGNAQLYRTFRLTTVDQVDRFILPRGYNNFDHDDDFEIRTRRIRPVGSNELEWLIHGIEHGGVSPPPNTRLSIMYDWNYYDTYAELAEAMGIPELQVANFEAAPFMTSLLSPAARNEYAQQHARALRKPTKRKRVKRARKMTKRK